MKGTMAIILALMVAAGGRLGAAELKSEGELKFGWVDLEKIFRSYYRTEKVLNGLENDLKAKEEQMQNLVDRIQTLEKEKELLSESGRLQKEGEITEQKLALRELRREAEVDLNKKILAAKEELLEEIIGKIEEKARAGGYTFILREELMVYGSPTLELTEDIIKELNQKEEK